MRRPGLGWYVLAGLVFLAALGLAAALVWRFVAAFEPPAVFLAPGEAQVWLAAPGEYILWHNYRTVHDGRSFDRPPKMPDGTRFRVHGPDGDIILLRGYGGMSSEGADGSSLSVGRFAAAQPGPHRVAVEGTFEARAMAVGPDRLWPIARLVGQVFVIVVLGLGLGIAAGLYGFLRAVDVAAGAPAQGEAEASLRKLVGLVYGLQAASLLVGITLFAGVIVNYLRRGEAAGTWLESHVTWQIRTFWWSLAWCVLGVATAVLMVGFLILAASALWFVYRIVKGWSELNEGRPMYR